MKRHIANSLVFLSFGAALMSVAASAYAQLVCSGSTVGYGNQVWGTTFGPTQLANACGVTAVGYFSLVNDTGSLNTAVGLNALYANTSGATNAGFGVNTLFSNTTGAGNSAVGAYALNSNTSGSDNNASGYYALYANTTASNNNAMGYYALAAATSGNGNSAMGSNSLVYLTTGIRNVGVGNNTGTSIVAGNYNTDIGWGVSGTADETGITRIGNPTYNAATYIAGITGTVVTGAAVYVTSSGQLGVLASSERYKTSIAPIDTISEKLEKLRPVSFHLKTDPNGAVQYGLIAEEVETVYPELVIHDQAGQIQGIRYEELAPMLLNEFQKQQQKLAAVTHSSAEQVAMIAAQAVEIRELKRQQEEMREALHALQVALTTSPSQQTRDAWHQTVVQTASAP